MVPDDRHETGGDPREEEEHVWRFPLAGERTPAEDPLLEMCRLFFRDFLRIGFFTREGARVNVDGFVFVTDPERVHEIDEKR